ncbi:MAG: hypothetical protein PHU85_15515 [Phycisphaerae bacterium]|nr:hypothetical protein [Phycisphaerae bacterium]
MSEPWRQISLNKGSQRFVFRYFDGDEGNVLDAFRSLANASNSGFDWFDAAVLAFKMARRLDRKVKLAHQEPPAKAAG